jgi:lysozyme family protein
MNAWLALLALALSLPCSGGGVLILERQRWEAATVRPQRVKEIDALLAKFERNRARYEAVSAAHAQGVPAIVIFCLHNRESGGNFSCHLHEGSPLTHRTFYVPKGRIPAPAQPTFLWETSACDAIYVCDRLGGVDWSDIGAALYAIEKYNGTGYLNRGVPSPYLWAGTSGVYSRGKYVADGKYDPYAVDSQLGCAAVLKRYFQLNGHL